MTRIGGRFAITTALVLTALGVSTPLAATPTVASEACTQMIVPAYWESNSDSDWNATLDAGSDTAPYVIFSPHLGPGSQYEQAWADVRSRLRAAGIIAVAYINTDETTVPLSSVLAQVDRYEAWYQPDGLFLDNADQAPSSVPYLRSVRDYMRSKMPRPTKLVLNVGIYPDESYTTVGDILNLEGTYQNYINRPPAPGWVAKYPKTRFSLIVVGATAAQMTSLVSRADALHLGYLYAASGSGAADSPPFTNVPSFWAQEVAQFRATCT